MAQALWMMNNEQLQKQINAEPGAARCWPSCWPAQADDQACEQLFQRVLARAATAEETADCASSHVRSLGDRRAAFEDLLWSLVNSAEFTTRR